MYWSLLKQHIYYWFVTKILKHHVFYIPEYDKLKWIIRKIDEDLIKLTIRYDTLLSKLLNVQMYLDNERTMRDQIDYLMKFVPKENVDEASKNIREMSRVRRELK